MRAARLALDTTPRPQDGGAWVQRAACIGTDYDWHGHTFLKRTNRPGNTGAYKMITVCAGCPVSVECLHLAMATEEGCTPRYGIFAGLQPRARELVAGQGQETTL